MTPLVYAFLLGTASLGAAFPVIENRAVMSLDQAATAEAQQRDATATRAFSGVPIKTSDGNCLFVDPLSGDFRENLTPIQVATCDGSQAQSWDVITAGKHNNVANSALIVSGLTQACFNFDPRRAAGNQVLLFSCGGRADGGGVVTNSQLFPFSGGAGPLALTPENAAGSCLTVKGAVIDIAVCNSADPKQSFTFGGSGASASTPPAASSSVAPATNVKIPSTTAQASVITVTQPAVTITQTVTSDCGATEATTPILAASTSTSTSSPAVVITSASSASAVAATSASPASAISVSRAGLVLNPSAAAEANPVDTTAVKTFTSTTIKSSSGQCLSIDPTAGDFRENLIPITLQPCDSSSPNQQWDFVTAGKHNNQPNSTLIVSSETQGCLNFDPRRAVGDTVIMFSCGGRADGGGLVTNSQLFTFEAGEKSLKLQPENGNGNVCLVVNAAGRLDQASCSDDPAQVFTIG